MTQSHRWQANLGSSRGRNRFLPLAFFCFLVVLSPVRAAKFTASLDRDKIFLGETVALKLEFDGMNPGGMPQLPTIPGLRAASGLASGSNTSIGPGGQQVVYWYSVQLMASQPGDYVIPAFQIEVDGQKYSSAPLRLKVLREDPNAPPAEFEAKSAFLWLTLPKTECYVGEIMVAELRLYLRQGVRNIAGFQPPPLQGDGFIASKQWTQGGQIQRRVGRRMFTVVPMYSTLTAVKTGPIRMDPLNASVLLNPPDVFDGIFGRRNVSEQVPLATDPKEIRALPLPNENVPPNFNGAVGSYTMTATVGPTNVTTGDPITVRVQIAGRGALEALALPDQTDWKDFKSYPPTAKVEISDQLGLQGTKTFEQVVTPEGTNVKELPPFSFSFFDPDQKIYRTLTQPAVPLTVRPGGTTPAPVVALKNSAASEPPPAQDIVNIKMRLGAFAQTGTPLMLRPWFVAVQTVPALAFLTAFAWRKRSESLANNPRRRRQRQVAQVIRTGLHELRRHAEEKNSDAFFATLVRLLQEQIGERFDCPASSITEAVVDEKLRPRGLPDTALTQLHELFQAANLARYAPVRSEQELVAVIPDLESALRALQEMKT